MSSLLRSQFSSVEETFLTSMIEPPEMESFAHFWSGLHITVAEGIKQQILDEETLAQAHGVACKVKTMAELLMNLYEKSDAFTASFQNDLAPLFADLSVDGQSPSPSHPIPPKPGYILMIHPVRFADYFYLNSIASAVKVADSSTTLAPYIRSAYTWLLSNLHNPYPSKEKKATIAEESGSSPKDIDNWFINARRRIGWNKLRSKHFQNKRSLIVDAATRFFKEVPHALHPHTTHTSGIDPNVNYDSEFKSIEHCTRALYPEKLFETPLATKLNEPGRDSIPEGKDCAQVECSEVLGGAEELQRLYAYPTPEHSPERSPELSVASLPIQDITPASNRKRRNSDRDSPDDEPSKRCRYIFQFYHYEFMIDSLLFRLDSYQFPMTQDQTAHQKNDCIIIPTPPIPAAPSGKRKRRLSDAGYDGPPKRPHNALAVPRLQTVSDPFPLANSVISELLKTTFDQTVSDVIPSPVSVESLDDTQVDINFYNYNTPPDNIQSFFPPDSLDPYPGKFSF